MGFCHIFFKKQDEWKKICFVEIPLVHFDEGQGDGVDA